MNAEESREIAKMIFEDKLYKWLNAPLHMNLHNYCKLLYFMKHNKGYENEIMQFLRINKIQVHNSNCITKGMVEYYKNTTYVTPREPKYYIDKEYFGVCGVNHDRPFAFYGNLRKDGIKYILHYTYYYYSKLEDNVYFVKFLIKCKQLGYSKEKFILSTKISEEFYDMVDNNYYEYLCKQTTYQQYLANQEFAKDSLSCMSFIDALRTSLVDLNANEITISADAIMELYEKANIRQHII